jgi:hypothetical protein
MNKFKLLLVGLLAMIVTAISAHAAIDLTPVTDEVELVGPAVVAALGVVAAGALGIMAVMWGGKAAVRFFKGLAK